MQSRSIVVNHKRRRLGNANEKKYLLEFGLIDIRFTGTVNGDGMWRAVPVLVVPKDGSTFLRVDSCPAGTPHRIPICTNFLFWNFHKTMSERRSDPRFEVCLDAVWDGAVGDRHTRIADLSEGGCYIDSIAEVYLGELLHLRIMLPNGEVLDVTAEVAHRFSHLGFGVRFLDLGSEALQRLRWFINHLQQEGTRISTRRSA